MTSSSSRPIRIGVETISAGSGFGPASGGMVVYFDGLLAALAESPAVESIVAFVPPWHAELGIPRAPKIRPISCRGLSRNRFGRILYEQLVLPIGAARQRPDVLLSTCNVKPFLWRGASVVVVQSIQYLFFPELYGTLRHSYLQSLVPASIQQADAVIAVSEWERKEIVARFKVDPDRVFTVHHGISSLVRKSAHAKVDGGVKREDGRPYVVMVSTLYRFKNHVRLIEAFAQVAQDYQIPHELVIAGGEADVTYSELQRVARMCGISNRVRFLGPVHHSEVPRLVAGADVVAYPSLMETFGHPIVEALALGRSVLTSNCGAMAEIAADAARLVDPKDSGDMAAGLAEVILDARLRERLARDGPRRAAEFTWERCAEGTVRALRYAIAHRTG